MALNKERKVLLGLLGSAGLILAADQLLLGPPRGAQASAPTGASATPAPAQSSNVPTAKPAATDSATTGLTPQAARQWNQRLDDAARDITTDDSSNPFAEKQVTPAEPAAPGVMSPDEFASMHELSLVMLNEQSSIARVNGRLVRIGEEVAGYRLVSLDARSALFQQGDQTVRLMLPKQSSGDP
ncbi:MAG: hypothetical protein ACIAS6_06115 [Phycisphaerales bacterium JB060]